MSLSAHALRQALAGRYDVGEELGRGGMSTVFSARDLRHDRDVAIKVLRPELSHAVGSERFLREIRIAAQLQHPHILPLFDSGEANGLLFYVMPLVAGESLRTRIARAGVPPLPEALKILRDVVDALSHAHGRRVVHRDVKPDNVMLADRHAMLMDFGVAKALSDAAGSSVVTSAGIAIGTPAYMAPEQAVGSAEVDHRADIYAVGAMAYELVTGAPPFARETPQMVLVAHVTDEPVSVEQVRPDLPPRLTAAIMRCLEKRAEDRWQSAADLRLEFEGMATPSTPSTPARARPIAPKPQATGVAHRWRVAAAAVGLVAMAVAVGVATRGEDGRPAPPVQRQVTFTGDVLEAVATPDGDFLAYAAKVDTGVVVKVMDVAGGSSLDIAFDKEMLCCLSWSPDGSQLFVGKQEGSNWGLVWVYPRLGGAGRKVTGLFNSRWTPDGTQYYSFVVNWSHFDIRTLATGQRRVRTLFGLLGLIRDVRQRPDGNAFAVATMDEAGTKSRIWFVPMDSASRFVDSILPASSANVMRSVDAARHRGKKLRLEAALRVESEFGRGQMFLRVDRPDRVGFYDNMSDRPVTSRDWGRYVIEGEVAQDAKQIAFGFLIIGPGRVWADDFRLSVAQDSGPWETVPLENVGFEKADAASGPHGWLVSGKGYVATLDRRNPAAGSAAVRLQSTDSAAIQQLVLEDRVPLSGLQWAPSGEALYYLRETQGSQDVWRVRINPQGRPIGAAELVLPGLDIAVEYWATLSITPDGRLYYPRIRRFSNLWTVHREGGAWRSVRLTSGTAMLSSPAPSPDGRRVAYVARQAGETSVLLIPTEGGRVERLTHGDSVGRTPAWSPDGRSVAVKVRRDGQDRIVVLNVADTGGMRVYDETRPAAQGFVRWWPSATILYEAPPGRQYGHYQILDPREGTQRPLIATPRPGWLWDARFSPDGKWLAGYWQHAQPGVYLISVARDSVRRLTPAMLTVLGWASDGRSVYVLDPTARTISDLPLDGGSLRVLVQLDLDEVADGAVIDDDHFVLVASGFTGDVWVAENFDPRTRFQSRQ